MGTEYRIDLVILSEKTDDLELLHKTFSPDYPSGGLTKRGKNWYQFKFKAGGATYIDKKIQKFIKLFENRNDVDIVFASFCDDYPWAQINIYKNNRSKCEYKIEFEWEYGEAYYEEDKKKKRKHKYYKLNIMKQVMVEAMHKYLKTIKK